MDSIYDALPPDAATQVQLAARLIYETREHRRAVLDAVGAPDEETLLERIRRGDIAEHPAYEHYLAARILRATHDEARALVNATLTEVKRP